MFALFLGDLYRSHSSSSCFSACLSGFPHHINPCLATRALGRSRPCVSSVGPKFFKLKRFPLVGCSVLIWYYFVREEERFYVKGAGPTVLISRYNTHGTDNDLLLLCLFTYI